MKKWLLLLLALALPLTGAAAQENTVVALPTVAPLQQVEASTDADYSSAPLEEYYNANFYMDQEDYQTPRMTAEEKQRTAELLVAYQAGERPAENVLNKPEDVVVGVYTLNPEDYEGETLYTLLPVDPLTDEQILEVIDAFARCGQTFDPEALSYRNCARGGGSGTTRLHPDEELERMDMLRDLYIRQGFESETPFTPLVSDDGMGLVTLDEDAYCGMDSFWFFPYRPTTDDELLGFVIYTETGDPTEYGNYAAYEKQLRLELARLLGAPLVMTRDGEDMCRMGDCNMSYGDEKAYYAYFSTPDGGSVSGYLDIDTGKVLTARTYKKPSLLYSDLHVDPNEEKWLEIAKQAVAEARQDGMAITAAESFGEVWISMVGYGVLVDVTMADGSYYEVKIACQNETVYGGLAYCSHAPDLEKMYSDMVSDND